MKAYISAVSTSLSKRQSMQILSGETKPPLYVLETFYYFKPWEEFFVRECKGFLLDSGAFTFMNSHKGSVDFMKYVDRYADCVKRYKISDFVELDVDSIIGRSKTEDLRKRLEDRVGTRCIPCWHKSRGVEEWCKLTEEYPRIALGGIVTKEITKQEYAQLPPLLKIARKNGCKVHVMGGGASQFQRMDIDSFDTASPFWSAFTGNIVRFTGASLEKIPCARGQRLKTVQNLATYALAEFTKYQYYLDGEKYEEDNTESVNM